VQFGDTVRLNEIEETLHLLENESNVITGKLVGMMAALGLVIVVAVAVPVGIMLSISGISVNPGSSAG